MLGLDSAVVVAVGSGVITGLITVVAMKTDIKWLKDRVESAHERIDSLIKNPQ